MEQTGKRKWLATHTTQWLKDGMHLLLTLLVQLQQHQHKLPHLDLNRRPLCKAWTGYPWHTYARAAGCQSHLAAGLGCDTHLARPSPAPAPSAVPCHGQACPGHLSATWHHRCQQRPEASRSKAVWPGQTPSLKAPLALHLRQNN